MASKEKTGKKQRVKNKKTPQVLIENQFKKGQSGNPNGRPKGTLNRATVLNQYLNLVAKGVKNPIDPDCKKVTQYDLVIAALIEKAKAGDINAIREVLDTIHGKIKNEDDLTIKGAIEHVETKKIDLSKITSEELKSLDKIVSKAAVKAEK